MTELRNQPGVTTPATNGHDSDRTWILRALRGEITSDAAYATIANTRWLSQQGTLTDNEIIGALNTGDNTHLDDPKRFHELDETWTTPVDIDPATVARFMDLTAGDEDGLHLEPVHPFIIWDDFWAEDTTDEEWLIDQVFAKGRGHALYAQAKQGKSLFVLERSARLAVTNPDCDVVYLDYEMTRSDVRDRLEDMGYGPTQDLSRLHYALLPAIPPLDTLEGANALLELCRAVHRDSCDLFVVIDTTGRAVIGEENSNDTIRGFYRWTGSALKRNEITWVRLDHAGKDVTKGQRGGSAKNDDVDIVWKLQAGDAGAITLHREAARMSWVPDHITFSRSDAPLRYQVGPEMWPAGTKDLATQLDELGLPTDIGRNKARQAINEAGISAPNEILGAACRWRASKARTDLSWAVDNPTDNSVDNPVDNWS